MSIYMKALVDPSEANEIEVVVVRRVRELIFGEHPSVFMGVNGIEFANVRIWEPGDPSTKINWPQSLRTNFNPIMVNESAEERTVDLLFAIDASLSVRCGMHGMTVAHVIARILATIGLSATLLQDRVGMMVFGAGEEINHAPKSSREHVWGLIDAYTEVVREGPHDAARRFSLTEAVLGMTLRPAMIICVSDFLDAWSPKLIEEAAFLDGEHHDVFLVVVDSAFAFDLPKSSSGWIACRDVESGKTMSLSARQARDLSVQVRHWQETIQKSAERAGLDVLHIHKGEEEFYAELTDFFLERRLHKR
jgi:uncharacterized protein (DUF58 family)